MQHSSSSSSWGAWRRRRGSCCLATRLARSSTVCSWVRWGSCAQSQCGGRCSLFLASWLSHRCDVSCAAAGRWLDGFKRYGFTRHMHPSSTYCPQIVHNRATIMLCTRSILTVRGLCTLHVRILIWGDVVHISAGALARAVGLKWLGDWPGSTHPPIQNSQMAAPW